MESIREINKNEIVSEGKKLLDDGAKFVTAVCNDLDDKLEVSYFFSKNSGTELICLRYKVAKDEEVVSLSGTTLATVLIDNEMKELFGLKIKELAIDYGGHLLLAQDSPVTPLLKTKKDASKGES
ncbi:MAG: NADH-quinone oxidoreductase subunit C [Deltaproteobacteria bacterium]|nr:NADH-quinone oxidoreductase subunit C [Deltaproteobacteria bacterium]